MEATAREGRELFRQAESLQKAIDEQGELQVFFVRNAMTEKIPKVPQDWLRELLKKQLAAVRARADALRVAI